MSERCPTCGQAVTVHTGSEGTSSYVKVAEAERDLLRGLLDGRKAERDSLQAQLDEAREALQEAHRYIRADDNPTRHRRMGMACGVDACILCLAEAVLREALSKSSPPSEGK